MAPSTPKSDRDPVIVSAARTPVGKFMGGLASLPATRLGALAVREAVKRAGIDAAQIDEVLLGQVVTAGAGQAPARQAAIFAGLPDSVGAVTLNKVCGSGLEAVMLAASQIKAGDGDLYVAGGMESMSNAPYLLPEERSGHKYGHTQVLDALQLDGLWCALEDQSMGVAAEFIADQFEVTREEMDEFAYHSHRKAIAAIDAGKFKDEIVPVEIKDAKGRVTIVETDEGPRRDTSLEALAKLKPAFKADGRVTAGNAPGMNDGAAALVVMSRATADRLGVKPLARIVGLYARGGSGSMVVHRARARHPQIAGQDQLDDGRFRSDRDQRSFRRAGDRRCARRGAGRASLGLEQGQRQRRRDRARPPDRLQRRPRVEHVDLCPARSRLAARSGHVVPGRRRGGGDGGGN